MGKLEFKRLCDLPVEVRLQAMQDLIRANRSMSGKERQELLDAALYPSGKHGGWVEVDEAADTERRY